MISLKKHLDDVTVQNSLTAELETSYQSALKNIAQNLPAVCPELVAEYRRHILALWNEFESQRTADVLAGNRQKLGEELRAFATHANDILHTKDKQFKEILKSFAEAAAMLAQQSETNDGRLTHFTRNLDSLIELRDLSEMRRRLSQEVVALKAAVAEMHRASQVSVRQLRGELLQFQQKLAQTEQIARTDSLTGLSNRGSGEETLRSASAGGKTFSIVLIDLNGFKSINDQWGHQAGDKVLRQFASRLQAAVRPGDLVCRWGGDEFLVLLPECYLAQAAERSQAFRRACDGEYRLTVVGKNLKLTLRTAVGIAEWQAGD